MDIKDFHALPDIERNFDLSNTERGVHNLKVNDLVTIRSYHDMVKEFGEIHITTPVGDFHIGIVGAFYRHSAIVFTDLYQHLCGHTFKVSEVIEERMEVKLELKPPELNFLIKDPETLKVITNSCQIRFSKLHLIL